MPLLKKYRRIKNGKEYEDIEFFLNDKSIAYATLQDDYDYYDVTICAVDDSGEKITNGFMCVCIELLDNIFVAFPEWEKAYFARENDSEDYIIYDHCAWCKEEFSTDDLKKTDLGYLCPTCIAAIRSRGEKISVEE